MIEFILANKTRIPSDRVSVAYNAFSFDNETIPEKDFESMAKGFTLKTTVEKKVREVSFNSSQFTLTKEWHFGKAKNVLVFNDPTMFDGVKVAYSGKHYHARSRTSVELAAALAATIAFQTAKPVLARKPIAVYCKSPADLAAIVISNLGFERVAGCTSSEFYVKYDAEQALGTLKAHLRNYDVSLTFMEPDGKRRELFQSLVGQNQLVFAEQRL